MKTVFEAIKHYTELGCIISFERIGISQATNIRMAKEYEIGHTKLNVCDKAKVDQLVMDHHLSEQYIIQVLHYQYKHLQQQVDKLKG